jgi:tRNA threonylcarbamoyladenosine biosynthesis protein TsaB
MLVLALDTTDRRGSVALVRDAEVLDVYEGDPALTHGRRLPGDVLRVLERQQVRAENVDVFAVAAGPGSFTGLRIGIATIQGFAFATRRKVVPVPTLDARAFAAAGDVASGTIFGVLMDAQRGEVFGGTYRTGRSADPADWLLDPPVVGPVTQVLGGWTHAPERLLLIGGAGPLVAAASVTIPTAGDIGALAPAIGRLGALRAARGAAVLPHAVQPVYVRRPDAELARERSRADTV